MTTRFKQWPRRVLALVILIILVPPTVVVRWLVAEIEIRTVYGGDRDAYEQDHII